MCIILSNVYSTCSPIYILFADISFLFPRPIFCGHFSFTLLRCQSSLNEMNFVGAENEHPQYLLSDGAFTPMSLLKGSLSEFTFITDCLLSAHEKVITLSFQLPLWLRH